jgi:hypothetical protein
VKALLPPERIIVLWNGVDEDSAVTMSLAEDAGKGLTRSYMVRSNQDFVVPAMTEMVISASVKGLEGLSMIFPRMDGGRRLIYAKNGVFELPESEEPFSIIVANFSQKARIVKRGQVIGVASPLNDSQVCLVPSEQKGETAWEHEMDEKIKHLPTDIRSQASELLSHFSDLWDGRLGLINAVEHRIPTHGSPIASQPYRAGPRAREDIDKEVSRMLEADVIEPAESEWASPIVLIPKPDGSLRFCVDYRKLNAITVRDQYALPRLDDCIDSLGEARVFSTLDANSGYWQIKVSEDSRDKTAFTCHRGLYRFSRMPFGLCNAPATFQRAVDVILATVRWQCAITYLDDIIVYSPSKEQHLKDLRRVLSLLRDAGIR